MFNLDCLSACFKQCLWPNVSKIWGDRTPSLPPTFPILSANFIHYIVISHGQHFDAHQSIPIPRKTGSSSCISFSLRATSAPVLGGGFPVLSANISPYMMRRHLPIFFSSRISCGQSHSSPSHFQRILRAAKARPYSLHSAWRPPNITNLLSLCLLTDSPYSWESSETGANGTVFGGPG